MMKYFDSNIKDETELIMDNETDDVFDTVLPNDLGFITSEEILHVLNEQEERNKCKRENFSLAEWYKSYEKVKNYPSLFNDDGFDDNEKRLRKLARSGVFTNEWVNLPILTQKSEEARENYGLLAECVLQLECIQFALEKETRAYILNETAQYSYDEIKLFLTAYSNIVFNAQYNDAYIIKDKWQFLYVPAYLSRNAIYSLNKTENHDLIEQANSISLSYVDRLFQLVFSSLSMNLIFEYWLLCKDSEENYCKLMLLSLVQESFALCVERIPEFTPLIETQLALVTGNDELHYKTNEEIINYSVFGIEVDYSDIFDALLNSIRYLFEKYELLLSFYKTKNYVQPEDFVRGGLKDKNFHNNFLNAIDSMQTPRGAEILGDDIGENIIIQLSIADYVSTVCVEFTRIWEIVSILELICFQLISNGHRELQRFKIRGLRNDIEKIIFIQGVIDSEARDEYKDAISYLNNEKKDKVISNISCAISVLKDAKDAEIILQAKNNIISNMRQTGENIEQVENMLDDICNYLLNVVKQGDRFTKEKEKIASLIYSNHSIEVNDAIITSLATAEIMYEDYIQIQRDSEFDYSCIALYYYKSLEAALNLCIYHGYREHFLDNSDILEDLYNNVVSGVLPPKSGAYYIKQNNHHKFKPIPTLTIAPIAQLFISMPEKFYMYLKEEKNIKCSREDLVEFGRKLDKLAPKRNRAAHGEVLPAIDASIARFEVVQGNENHLSEIREMLLSLIRFFDK